MLTQSARRELETLFAELHIPNERVTINSLEGFLYAVAITPDIIMPSEWLPEIFGGEIPPVADKQHAGRLMTALSNAYNHYNGLRLDGVLRFPYAVNELRGATPDAVLEWCYGFLQGLKLRMDLWMGRTIPANSAEQIDLVANSVGVVRALAEGDLEGLGGFLDEIEAGVPEGETDEKELKAYIAASLLMSLPVAVENLQVFAEQLAELRQKTAPAPIPTGRSGRQPQRMRSKKVGRNEPCPCGSGKKYKKCCGGGN